MLRYFTKESTIRRAYKRYTIPECVTIAFAKSYGFEVDSERLLFVKKAFLEYMMVVALNPGRVVSMPSKTVDDFWHQFILHTREYKRFCLSCFGEFIHHEPKSLLDGHVIDRADRAFLGLYLNTHAGKDDYKYLLQHARADEFAFIWVHYHLDGDTRLTDEFNQWRKDDPSDTDWWRHSPLPVAVDGGVSDTPLSSGSDSGDVSAPISSDGSGGSVSSCGGSSCGGGV